MNTLFSDNRLKNYLWAMLFALLLIVPWLHLLDSDSSFYLSSYWVTLLGRILCFALVALALDIVWGYTGILSLGHGLYFSLGGYAMGMYLTQASAGGSLPEFVQASGLTELPWFYAGTQYFGYAMLLVLLLPGLVALVFGFFAFKAKIKGVYFAIITQAMTFAATLLFLRNETGFGGNSGFSNFSEILGFSISAPSTRSTLLFITVLSLLLCFVGLRWLMSRPFGRVLQAIRDEENRLQYLGYQPFYYKLSVWVLSAMIAGLAGALYVPQVGIINPTEMSTSNSIEMVVWVAMGGRGNLSGAIIGAGLVNSLKSYFSIAYPTFWLLLLGGLFVAVTLYLPKGLVGLFSNKSDEAKK